MRVELDGVFIIKRRDDESNELNCKHCLFDLNSNLINLTFLCLRV